jgi:hypothetical protein
VAVFNHTMRREQVVHPIGDPLTHHLVIRSTDRGETWETPQTAPGYDWYGVECPGIGVLQDGTVVLTQWRWNWYPMTLARARLAEGEALWVNHENNRWVQVAGDEELARSWFPYVRGNRGLFAHLSRDDGLTFQCTVQIDTAPYPGGFTRTGVVQMASGRVAYALGEVPAQSCAFAVLSDDGCQTWSQPIRIGETPDFGFPEPHLAEVAPDELVCILRDGLTSGYLHVCRSTDGGESWSAIERTPMFGHPGHLLVLADGRLLCTYGHRQEPFGIRACWSEDGGRTWRMEQEIVMRDDLPHGDLGYPTTIEYEPGRLFCIYYAADDEGVRGIYGTYVELG